MSSFIDYIYEEEKEYLCPFATFSSETKGRVFPTEPSIVRTEFQRDRDRIVHSKSFRRLKHKTQVFLSPEGDHYRTRLTHTLEVMQIARTIARALRLNEDLTEAIALGHDLGHTPFGHAGERVLNNLTDGYFHHFEQSIRVVEYLETGDDNKGAGLNLTYEVKDGILNHTEPYRANTLEGNIVRMADLIAYINHDIDDGIRAGILMEKDLPKEATSILGNGKSERINNMVLNIVNNSYGKNFVAYTEDFEKAQQILKQFMFDNLYFGSKAKVEEVKAERIVEYFYKYYFKRPEELPDFYKALLDKFEKKQVVCDYVSSMTDNYMIKKFGEMVIPSEWK